MKAYSEYKAMNLPWLKAIPAHWEIRRNKNVFTEMKAYARTSRNASASLPCEAFYPKRLQKPALPVIPCGWISPFLERHFRIAGNLHGKIISLPGACGVPPAFSLQTSPFQGASMLSRPESPS